VVQEPQEERDLPTVRDVALVEEDRDICTISISFVLILILVNGTGRRGKKLNSDCARTGTVSDFQMSSLDPDRRIAVLRAHIY
jgi:hypothetical protein